MDGMTTVRKQIRPSKFRHWVWRCLYQQIERRFFSTEACIFAPLKQLAKKVLEIGVLRTIAILLVLFLYFCACSF
jgi:hypothetical protein